MHNLDEIVKMYFSCVPAQDILNEKISYEKFPAFEFERLSKAYITYYSDTENGNLYEYIAGSNKVEGHPYAGLRNRSGLNVFAALEELAEQVLIMEENEVLCKYSELLRFRNVTNYIEEDLLVCAFLVVRGRRYLEPGKHSNFGWDTIIRHNNVQLRGILQEGISENHFHLYGSAPVFHLMWLDLMNNLPDENQIFKLCEIGNRPRVSRNHYYIGYQEEGYERVILKAALIRVFLITYLMDENLIQMQSDLFNRKMEMLLRSEEPIEGYRMEIQKAIDFLKAYFLLMYGKEAVDYALYQVDFDFDISAYDNTCFAGERWLIYQMLKKEMQGENTDKKYFQWFYAYLVMKHHFRQEIAQTNDAVGFENFQIYTKRKRIYYDNTRIAMMAVYSSFLTANLRALEIRINIKESARENAEMIAYYDSLFDIEENKRNIYYVLSFSKKADDFQRQIKKAYYMSEIEREELVCQLRYFCRHYRLRKELNVRANELQKFRERYPQKAKRVLGIDACSQEIGCRPEIFAPVFRFLANHVVDNWTEDEVSQLKITYHVGEDFLDVVDGLRAVDEAVHFLNLQCGDRIGHGTVLGINVCKWYLFKSNTIVLPQQDYLDNVAWMYHKLTEFKIQGCESLQQYLSEQFDIYFSKIYGHSMQNGNTIYSLHSYYEAWKLRGDEPELYVKGEFDRNEAYNHDYLINYDYPQMFDSRYRAEVSKMYYLYHYSFEVREEGAKTIELRVPPIYVDGVCKIQKAMQKFIASCGIGVETNPSSNLLISTMGSYDEHPIIRLFNKHLTYDEEMLKECAQVNVSINTDDKGVFRTSLENEYALMACALEKVRDKEGGPVYNRQMIFEWLDDIRKMGNLQSFYKEE